MKTLKQRWINALRSGEYKQGNSCLRDNKNGESCFCCLGVLLDIIDSNAWEGRKGPDVWKDSRDAYTHGHVEDVLEQDLVAMNDGGESFLVIADYIEEHVMDTQIHSEIEPDGR